MIDMFEVGQTVWDVRMGRGVVTGIKNVGPWPIRVKIDHNGTTQGYTPDGKYQTSDLYRSLYFSEPSVSGATTPPFTRKIKDGETVILRSKSPSGSTVAITVVEENEHYIWDTHLVKWFKSGYTIHRIGEEIY